MDAAGIGQEPDVIACREAKFADRTCGKIADARNVDMEERVAAEMLGHRHLSLPTFAVAGCLQMLGADADRFRSVALCRLPSIEFMQCRAIEPPHEKVAVR